MNKSVVASIEWQKYVIQIQPGSGILATFAERIGMAEAAWYKDWFNSTFYHKLYFERDDKEASDFIRRLISHLNPAAGSRMFDVACGRGRHSKILAAYGYQVTGIDLSPDSIADAQKNGNGNPEFYVHDMRLPFLINYFDYAFNFFTSFGFFKTRREHDDVIRTIANSLKPGGVLIFDYLNVHYAEERLVHNEVKEIGGTVYEIHRWSDESHFFKKIIVKDKSLSQPIEYTEQVAKFSLHDFIDMLSFRQIQVEEVFGNYQLNNYDIRKTPRLIIKAVKQRH